MTNMKFRPTKSRGSIAPISPRAASSSPLRGTRHDRRNAGARARPASRPWLRGRRASRTGAEADRDRLRLLDLHSQRHGDVLLLLRGLRRAVGKDRGRPAWQRAVQSQECRDRDRLPPDVELCLRHGQHRRRHAQQILVPDRDGGDLRAGAGVPVDRIPRIRRSGRARRRSEPQRLPVVVLYAGRLSRPACLGRHSVAADHDGAGVRQRLSRRYSAPLPVLRAVLACARHHLGRGIFDRLSARERDMSELELHDQRDGAPGDEEEVRIGPRLLAYLAGLGLAILLTATSFFVAGTDLVWQPSIPVAIVVLAIAQMGVHLVFFLHITTGPDNTNNVMALAFGVLIVVLVIGGSLWIMANLNHNMLPMDQIMRMQR